MLINNDLEQLHSNAMEFVLSDDIWNKFELPVFDCVLSNPFSELDDDYTMTSLFGLDNFEIRNHDCMWAGHCGSKEHPVDEVKPPIKPFVPVPAPAQPAKQTPAAAIAPGRSLLIKTQNQTTAIPASPTSAAAAPASTAAAPMMPGLDSPPNSDDEDVKVTTETLKLLQDAISECDLKDDSDLYDYWDDDELLEVDDEDGPASPEEEQKPTPPPQPPQQQQKAQATIVISDHCYHKDKNASMRINNLGLETPSDSEEEIDVVSVGEKQTSRMVCALPNNPSSRDKQQLQRTMASAITKNGIKTFPARKTAPTDHSPAKRPPMHHQDSRGAKRPKHHRSPPISPYKKRSPAASSSSASYNHSSDSEPEPSEKRSLHNNMERQRRIGLRNAFEDLRCLVPEVSKRDRAPKVVILREAAVYCHRLGDVSEGMLRQIEDLRRQQKRLRARVSQLRLSLAAKHR